jgi:hypothetical protein
MAETTADVRRDIEMTRERMSTTLAQIEQKMNLMQIVRDHPWPAIAVAVGAGVLLSRSGADIKAAGATVVATRGASSKIGTVLDDVVANLMTGVSQAFQHRVDSFVTEIKQAIGAPTDGSSTHSRSGYASQNDGRSSHTQDNWSSSTGGSGTQGLGGETRSSGSHTGPLGTDRGSNIGSQQWQPGV